MARRLPTRILVLEDKLNVGLKNLRNQGDADLSGTTGTITIYNSSGGTTLASTALTITGTTLLNALYFLDTLGILAAAGEYTAIFTITDPLGNVENFVQTLNVLANPML